MTDQPPERPDFVAPEQAPRLKDLGKPYAGLLARYASKGQLRGKRPTRETSSTGPSFIEPDNVPPLDDSPQDHQPPSDFLTPSATPTNDTTARLTTKPRQAEKPALQEIDLAIALNRLGVLVLTTPTALLSAVISVGLLVWSSANLVIGRYTLSLVALAAGATFSAVGVVDVYRLRRVWPLGAGLTLLAAGWIGIFIELDRFASDLWEVTYVGDPKRPVLATTIASVSIILISLAGTLALNPMLPPRGRPGARAALDAAGEEGQLPVGYRLRDVGTVLKSTAQVLKETVAILIRAAPVLAHLGTTYIGLFGSSALGIVGAKSVYDAYGYFLVWPASAIVLATMSVVFGATSALGALLAFGRLMPALRTAGKIGQWLVAISHIGLIVTYIAIALYVPAALSLALALVFGVVPLVGAVCAFIAIRHPLAAEPNDNDTEDLDRNHDCEHDDETECTTACAAAQPPDPNKPPFMSYVASWIGYVIGSLTFAMGLAIDTYDFRSARPFAMLIGVVTFVGGLMLYRRMLPLVLALGQACGIMMWISLTNSSPLKRASDVMVFGVLLLVPALGLVAALWPSNWRWVLSKKRSLRQARHSRSSE